MNTGVLKMQAQRKHATNLFKVSKFDEFQSINIINIPLFALFWGWIHVYLYLGPSDIHHVHVIHLDLNNLRHFQVIRKHLVLVVLRALNCLLRRWLAMMAEFTRGKGWDLNFLGVYPALLYIYCNWIYDN